MERYNMNVVIAVYMLLSFSAFPLLVHRGGANVAESFVTRGPAGNRDVVTQSAGTLQQNGQVCPLSTRTKPVAERLAQDPSLVRKLEDYLELSGPDAGAELQAEATGFDDLGQFVAAVHIAKNLGIPFDDFKGAVVQNGRQVSNLGKAVRWFRPGIPSGAETRKATQQASADLKREDRS